LNDLVISEVSDLGGLVVEEEEERGSTAFDKFRSLSELFLELCS
jgi:hypothetical protein